MGRRIRLQNQAGQSKTSVAVEVRQADATRGRESLVILKRLANLCISRRCRNIICREPDNLARVAQNRVAWVRVGKELKGEWVNVDSRDTLRWRIVVKRVRRGGPFVADDDYLTRLVATRRNAGMYSSMVGYSPCSDRLPEIRFARPKPPCKATKLKSVKEWRSIGQRLEGSEAAQGRRALLIPSFARCPTAAPEASALP